MKLDRKAKRKQRENRAYWQKHLTMVQDELFDKSRDEITKRIADHYTSALQKIKADMLEVMEKVASGDYNMNELYKFNRYAELQQNINKHLKALGRAEIDIMGEEFKSFYKMADKATQSYLKDTGAVKGSFSLVNDKAVEKAVNDIWCSDKQRWSSRIWKNKAILQQTLERGLVDCVARGTSRETLVKEIMERMGAAYYEADRIVRTELAQIQNAAAVNRYKESGTKKVETVACKDARTCPICKKKDGKITDIDKALPGVAYLFHPNCRCLVVPVVEVPKYTAEDRERLAQEAVDRLTKKRSKLGTKHSEETEYRSNGESLGKIDPEMREDAADYYGDMIRMEKAEHAITIEKNGTVSHFKGTSNGVNLEGVNFDDAIIVHNHPVSEGIVSFGEDDFTFLRENQKINKFIAVNEQYTYSVKVLKDISDLIYNDLTRWALEYVSDENFELQHAAFQALAERGYVQYERKEVK